MKDQEKIEKALKDIHLLFAKSESMPDDANMVIVDKKALFRSLEEINRCMYSMMDSYEITKESRERQERKTVEKCDKTIAESKRVAEDIYAAAVMYTDDTMKKLYDEIRKTQTEVVHMTELLADEIDRKLRKVVENRAELREQLSETSQRDKYLRLIRRENAKNKEAEEEVAEDEDLGRSRPSEFLASQEFGFRDDPVRIMAPAPQIKIDPAYEVAEDRSAADDEGVVNASPNIQVNYDSAYFKMKQAEMGEEDFEEGVVEPEEDFVEGVVEPEDDFVEGVVEPEDDFVEGVVEPDKEEPRPEEKKESKKKGKKSSRRRKTAVDVAKEEKAAEPASDGDEGSDIDTAREVAAIMGLKHASKGELEFEDDFEITDLSDNDGPEEFLVSGRNNRRGK
ncbi:MAG: hypothetical protein K5840_02240 [Eubacterium sp.]|nr:hypothetical protein [Eubacterium sp.]